MENSEMLDIINEVGKLCQDIGSKNLEELTFMLSELGRLVKKSNYDERLIEIYHNAIIILMLKQDLKGREESIKKIEEIVRKFPKNEQIAVTYIGSLVNITVKQDLKGIQESVEKAEKIVRKFPNSIKIAIEYAMILFNLSLKQDLKGIQESVEKLKEVVDKYPENEEIVIQYVKCIFNLSNKQDKKNKETNMKKLEKIVFRFPNDIEITHIYLMGLFNLSNKKRLEERKEIIEKMKKIAMKFHDNLEMQIQYAKALFNLTFHQDLIGRTETIEKIKEIRKNNFKTNNYINIIYLKSILNLIDLTKKVDLHKVLEKIDKEITEEDVLNFSPTEIEDVIDFSMKTKNTYMFISKLLFLFKEKLQDTKYEFFIKILDKYKSNDKIFENMSNLYIITKKIMHELSICNFENLKLAHYSDVETIPFLIKSKRKSDTFEVSKNNKVEKEIVDSGIVKLRLNNASYMNDPLEGSILLKYLRQEIKGHNFLKEILDEFESDFEDIPKVSSVYLFSLTQSIDKLPMWSEYGKKGNGVCLTFKNSFFDVVDPYEQNIMDKSNIERVNQILVETEFDSHKDVNKINSDEEKSKERECFCPYKICYINSENGNLSLDTERYENIKEYIDDIKKYIKKININLKGETHDLKQLIKEDIKECLEQIRYLFKSSDYEHEKEVRLLKYVDLNSDKIKLNEDKKPVPWLYIERDDGVGLEFTEVILGPKVENVGYIAPYIKYCDEKIVVKKSEIKYR